MLNLDDKMALFAGLDVVFAEPGSDDLEEVADTDLPHTTFVRAADTWKGMV